MRYLARQWWKLWNCWTPLSVIYRVTEYGVIHLLQLIYHRVFMQLLSLPVWLHTPHVNALMSLWSPTLFWRKVIQLHPEGGRLPQGRYTTRHVRRSSTLKTCLSAILWTPSGNCVSICFLQPCPPPPAIYFHKKKKNTKTESTQGILSQSRVKRILFRKELELHFTLWTSLSGL